jgi:hypothetical protein
LKVDAKRITLYSDAITTAPRNYHVGSEILLEGGGGYMSTASHEPAKIRECLLEMARTWTDPLDNNLKIDANAPWKVYANFLEMHNDNAIVRAQFRDILTNHFVTETQFLVDVLNPILSQSSTYKSWISHGDSSDRQRRLTGEFGTVGQVGNILSAAAVQREVKKKLTALTHVQDDMDKYIGLCLILSELISNPRVPMDWISSDPTLAACLRS